LRKVLKDKGAAFQALGSKIQATMANEEAAQWKDECALIGKSMQKAVAILEKYGQWAGAKDYDAITGTSMDFLNYCGNLIVGWRLLNGAVVASKLLKEGSYDDKAYLQSKIVDFKVFCQHFLTRNSGLAQSILNFEQDWTKLEL